MKIRKATKTERKNHTYNMYSLVTRKAYVVCDKILAVNEIVNQEIYECDAPLSVSMLHSIDEPFAYEGVMAADIEKLNRKYFFKMMDDIILALA